MRKINCLFIYLFAAVMFVSCSQFLNSKLNLDHEIKGVTEDDINWRFDFTSGKLSVEGNESVDEFTWEILDSNLNISLVKEVELSEFQSIGDNAFSGFIGLRKITSTTEIRNIGSGIFSELENNIIIDLLMAPDVNISDDFGDKYFGFGYLLDENNSELHIIGKIIPDYKIIQHGVDYEYNYPWENFEGKVILHNGITRIGKHSFHSHGTDTQSPCFLEFELPETLEVIAELAFFQCKEFDTITIPNSVNIIEYGAFFGINSEQTIFLDWLSTDTTERDLSGIMYISVDYNTGQKNYLYTEAKVLYSDGVDAKLKFMEDNSL